MDLAEKAEEFARARHSGGTKKGGKAYCTHLQDVVNRLKGMGVSDQDVLSAGWLHDIMEATDTTFDEILQRFGSRVAVMVLSLTEDESMSRARREKLYIQSVRDAPPGAKVIKLCDISANLGDIRDSGLSRSGKARRARQMRRYAAAAVNGMDARYHPSASHMVGRINDILVQLGQRRIRMTQSDQSV